MNDKTYEKERPEHLDGLNAAHSALKAGRHSEALEGFKRLADEGSPTALINLGWMHQTGSVVQRNLAQAKHYYMGAVETGSVMALNYLAAVYRLQGDLEGALDH